MRCAQGRASGNVNRALFNASVNVQFALLADESKYRCTTNSDSQSADTATILNVTRNIIIVFSVGLFS